MKIEKLAEILDKATATDQGLNYHNGSPKTRYDSETGERYVTYDPTHLFLYGERAQNFYDILNGAKTLAKTLRDAVGALRDAPDPAMYKPDEFQNAYTEWFERQRIVPLKNA